MVRHPIHLLAGLAALGLVACGGPTQSSPAVTGVRPGAVGNGSDRYVTLSGTGFDPTFPIDPVTGKAGIDTKFAVSFAGTPSDVVTWFSKTTLMAKLPSGIPSGMAQVTVTAPDGGQGSLDKGLCVGAVSGRQRLEVDYTGGLLDLAGIDLEAADPAGGTPTILARATVFRGTKPFSVSPDGQTVVFHKIVGVGAKQRETLYALHLASGGTPTAMNVTGSVSGRAAMEDLAFTPDGKTLLYVLDGTKLVAQKIPDPGANATAPTVLATAGPGNERLADPVVDPTGTEVLFSRVSHPDPQGMLVGEKLALYEVPLKGGTPKAILDERDKQISDGPGLFLPDGRGILFVSDRMGLVTPITVGINQPERMVAATNLFILDPDTGKITAISPPTLEAFVLPPVLSPDGRWVAASEVRLDLANSLVDLFLTDLSTGETFRAIADPKNGPKTYDIDPSFSPDGRTVYATAVSYVGAIINGISSYEVAVPQRDPHLPVGKRTLPASSITPLSGTLLEPVEVDAYAGCN